MTDDSSVPNPDLRQPEVEIPQGDNPWTQATAVDSEEEAAAARRIYVLLHTINAEGQNLQPLIDVQPGSSLALDDARLSGYPLSNYAFGQLQVAFGCFDSLRRMIISESPSGSVSMVTNPHGPYALIRNAMDTAALARWLLVPENRKLRLRRRIMAEMDELAKSLACRKESQGRWLDWESRRRERMQQVADAADIGLVKVKDLKLPPMTRILTDLQRGYHGTELSWLATWQLCSGHAHGKLWALLASNDLEVQDGSATEIGAQYRMTVDYRVLCLFLERGIDLVNNAAQLYRRAATVQ